nr:MFS transporter [Saccharopolyspora gloriosae]
MVLPIVLTATFMQLLDVTIAQVGLPAIQRDLRIGPGAAQLVLAGYTLTYACTLVPAGRLGDRYGYRRLFTTGVVLFVLASATCAAAPTGELLVLARLVQGVGSGLMGPQVLSILQSEVPVARRPHALGLLTATMGIASLIGPALGGVLLAAAPHEFGWRLVFLVNVPVGLLALAGSRLLPRGRTAAGVTVDWLGAVLATTGLGSLILPVALGRDLAPWSTWACFAVSGTVLGAFALTQRRARDPLLHPSVLRDPTTRTGILLVLMFNAGLPSFNYLLLMHLQISAGHSALAAGLLNAPYPIAAIAGSRVAPRLAARFGPRLLAVAAALFAAAASALILGISSTWATLALLVPAGAAFGVFTASAFTLVLSGVEPAAAGSAAGLLPTAQQLGGSLGVALAGATYFTAGQSFGHAMAYEAAVFLCTAGIALRVRR